MQLVTNEGRQLCFSRTFDAPRSLVWEAWTDPQHIAQWWGPDGFATSVVALDLREGGTFHLALLGPDGQTYPCKGTYAEIISRERIVLTGLAMDGHPCGAGLPPRATMTISFDEADGRTTVTIETHLATPADREAALQHGFREGWAASFNSLARYLSERT